MYEFFFIEMWEKMFPESIVAKVLITFMVFFFGWQVLHTKLVLIYHSTWKSSIVELLENWIYLTPFGIEEVL